MCSLFSYILEICFYRVKSVEEKLKKSLEFEINIPPQGN